MWAIVKHNIHKNMRQTSTFFLSSKSESYERVMVESACVRITRVHHKMKLLDYVHAFDGGLIRARITVIMFECSAIAAVIACVIHHWHSDISPLLLASRQHNIYSRGKVILSKYFHCTTHYRCVCENAVEVSCHACHRVYV